jgi:hypothetical protein
MNKPENLRVRDIRSLPFLWIQRALFDTVQPSWRAIVAYNALAYFSSGQAGTCKDISIKRLAEKVAVSEDTIKRGLEELADKKAIRIKARYKKGTREQLANEYVLIDLGVPDTAPI